MVAEKLYAVLAIVPIVAWILYSRLKTWRFQSFNQIPQTHDRSIFLGHLPTIAKCYKKLGDGRRHIDYILCDMLSANGNPEIMFLDLRPVARPLTVINSHEIAEQISRATQALPWSVGKSPTLRDLQRLIGRFSMISANGEEWKMFRRRFNMGFAPQHILTLLPVILQKTSTFVSKLDALAESGVPFDIDPLCTNLTFDIIGEVVTNLDCHAQDDVIGGHDIVRTFRKLSRTFHDDGRIWLFLNIPVRIKRLLYSYQNDRAIKNCIRDKFAEIKAAQKTETKQTKDRSILALALQDTDILDDHTLQVTADQVKSFLFAGHDTTSILLQRLFYALSLHPKALATLRAELDAVFGTANPEDVFLAKPDETIKSLTYTSACIKEALRLWPPASSVRMAPTGTGFKVRTSNGDEVLLDGTVLYQCHYLIHRDPKVYGPTANDFMPERWIGDSETSAEDHDESAPQTGSAGKIPISAWRPFERGPRNCIGQELANLEARVILACVMGRFNFEKVGVGEVERDAEGRAVVDEEGVYKAKSELFNMMVVTSKPIDSKMRISRHRPGA